MDLQTLQRNLTTLENRYRELREISETRLQASETDKTLLKQKIEQLNSELADAKESAQQLDLLRLQFRQATEKIDLIHQKLDSTEQELRNNNSRLDQAQEELRQTQEELKLKSGNLEYLQSWRYQTEYSIKNQLKLIRKTLAIRFVERLRRILPAGFGPSNKL